MSENQGLFSYFVSTFCCSSCGFRVTRGFTTHLQASLPGASIWLVGFPSNENPFCSSRQCSLLDFTSPMRFTSRRHFLRPASSRTPSTLSIREIFFKSCQEASSRLAWGGSASFPSPCGLIRKPHERDENDDDDSDDGNDGESCLRRRQLFVGYYSQRAREKVQWPLLLRPMQNR